MLVFVDSDYSSSATNVAKETLNADVEFYDFHWDPNNHHKGYGVGKQDGNKDIVLQYNRVDDSASAAGSVYIWQMKSFTQDPAAGDFSTTTNGVRAARIGGLIISGSLDPSWVPIYGFLAGGSTKAANYRDRCTNLEFQIFPYYTTVFESTNQVGFLGRLEHTGDSCVSFEYAYTTTLCTADNNGNFKDTSAYTLASSANFNSGPVSEMSLLAISGNNPGDWESSLNLATCDNTHNDPVSYVIDPAIYDGDDIAFVNIGTTYNLPFNDWTLQTAPCTMQFTYQTIFSGPGTPTTDITATYNLGPPHSVDVLATSVALNNVNMNLEVLATTTAGQCLAKDITITPISCPNNQITGAMF